MKKKRGASSERVTHFPHVCEQCDNRRLGAKDEGFLTENTKSISLWIQNRFCNALDRKEHKKDRKTDAFDVKRPEERETM